MDRNKYRTTAMTGFYEIIDNFRAARRYILDHEAHQPTIKKQIDKLTAEAAQKLKTLTRDLDNTVNDFEKIAKIALEEARREGKDPARVGYVQVNAQNAFDGLSPEEIIEKYPEYVKTLHTDDKPFQWVIDDLVKAKVRGQGNAEVLNHVIFQNMPAGEKVAQAQLAQVEQLKNSHSTLTGLMEMTLNDVAAGYEKAKFDVAETFDTLMGPPNASE